MKNIKKIVIIGSLVMLSTTNLLANTINIKVQNINKKKDGQLNVFILKDDDFPKVHHNENSDVKVSENETSIYPNEALSFLSTQQLGLFSSPIYKNSKINKKQFLKDIIITVLYS